MGRAFERMRFAHLGLSPHPRSPTAAGLAPMRKGSLASFTAPPIQTPSLLPAHSPAIASKRLFLFERLVRPTSVLLPPLRDIRSHAPPRQPCQQSIVAIALVHHRLLNLRGTARQHQIGFRQAQGYRPALRIRLVRKGDRRCHNGLALQIHRVLGFVGQMMNRIYRIQMLPSGAGGIR